MKDIYTTVNLHNKIVITAERPSDLSITFHILFVPKMHWNGTKAGHTYKKAANHWQILWLTCEIISFTFLEIAGGKTGSILTSDTQL